MGKVKTIKDIDINKIVPYENNAKVHDDNQIEKIASSIKEFGFLTPCLIDKDYNLIAGHGRLLAAQKMGLAAVPCVFVEGLTEEQRKAYILADNRLSEFGSWDMDLLAEELESIQVDFDLDEFEFKLPEEDLSIYYGDERERTNSAYNLNLPGDESTGDFWQMPTINNDGHIPENLIGFNYAKTSKDKTAGIHFFIDDYQFERVWNYPEKYVVVLEEYDCILSPDFSLYTNMPMPMKIWNVYRSRKIGAYYQSLGIKVIPTVSWAEEDTFSFCFEGIPQGSIVAISTIGVKENKDAIKIWNAGVDRMLEIIEPETVLIYGGKLDYDFKKTPVRFYENGVLERWKKGYNK